LAKIVPRPSLCDQTFKVESLMINCRKLDDNMIERLGLQFLVEFNQFNGCDHVRTTQTTQTPALG